MPKPRPSSRPGPTPVVQQRLQRCRVEMRRAGIGAYLITHRPDQVYLTGFDGEDGAALITPRDVHLITDGRFAEVARRQAPWAKTFLRGPDLAEGIAAVLRQSRYRTVALQSDRVSVETHRRLRRLAQGVRLASAPPIANQLRRIKDRAEVTCIRAAIRVAQEAFEATRRRIRAGMTEGELAARLEFEMRVRGASGPSFSTIVAEGQNAALPHAVPGARRIKRDSMILVDWGAVYGGYCSDLTRVLFMGRIRPRLKLLYQTVLEAQLRAIEALAPGRRVCDIDAIARDHIARAGFGQAFGHGLGHGVGLEIHEPPRLKAGFTDLLEPGMVVTIEPGIYIPGLGGIRIEDDVLITSSGHEVLTTLDKSLRWASA